MGKQDHECDCNREHPVDVIFDIKDHQDKNRECNTGEYRTDGYKSGKVEYD